MNGMATKRRRLAGLLVAAVLVAAVAVAAVMVGSRDPMLTAYHAIDYGTPQARVVELLGPPGPHPPYRLPDGGVSLAWTDPPTRSMLILLFDAAGNVRLKTYVYHDETGKAYVGGPPPWWEPARQVVGRWWPF